MYILRVTMLGIVSGVLWSTEGIAAVQNVMLFNTSNPVLETCFKAFQNSPAYATCNGGASDQNVYSLPLGAGDSYSVACVGSDGGYTLVGYGNSLRSVVSQGISSCPQNPTIAVWRVSGKPIVTHCQFQNVVCSNGDWGSGYNTFSFPYDQVSNLGNDGGCLVISDTEAPLDSSCDPN